MKKGAEAGKGEGIYYLSKRGRREDVSCQNSQGMLVYSDFNSGSFEDKRNFEFKRKLHIDNHNSTVNPTFGYLTTIFKYISDVSIGKNFYER
jgi:hypothetical protein